MLSRTCKPIMITYLCLFMCFILKTMCIPHGSSSSKDIKRHFDSDSNNETHSPNVIRPGNWTPTTNDKGTTNVVCYLSIGGTYTGNLPPALNLTLCTHVIFLGSRIINAQVAPSTEFDIPLYYQKVKLMKKLKPSLKVLLSNGGGGVGGFDTVMLSAANRKLFAQSIIPYLTKYSFDGFDLDWEFPAWGSRSPEQRHNYSLVLQVIRETFNNYTDRTNSSKFLLTAAVPSTLPLIIQCYEVPELAKYLDFVNLMSYDIHLYSKISPFTGYNSPMYSGNSILDKTIFYDYNMVRATEIWVQKGMAKGQMLVGIPAYAHTFDLLSDKSHGLYSLATGYNKTLGDQIMQATVCSLLKNFVEVWDDECMVPYAYDQKTWISYENAKSVSLKAKWIQSNGYGGVMTFSLNSDDYIGASCGTKWPIHNAIYHALK